MSPLTLSLHLLSPPSMITSLLFILFLLLLLHHAITPYFSKKLSCPPPSPRGLPILGNLHQLGPLPHRTLRGMSLRHGPLLLLKLGRIPALVASSVDTAREVLKTQDNLFASRPSLKVPATLFYDNKDIAFAPYGDYWRQVKKLSVLHLMSSKMVDSFKLIREQEVALLVEAIARASASRSTANMSELFASLSKHIISRVIVGKPSREEEWDSVLHLMIQECSLMLGSFHVGDYFPALSWAGKLTGLDAKLKTTMATASEILEAIIEQRLARSRDHGDHRDREPECFVDVLLSAVKDNTMGISFGKENIKAIVTDLFGAGTDSTYIVMEWTMAELVRNPKAMKKLKEEIRGIVGSNPTVSEEDLASMPYLKAVIKETLRLHPPGPLLVPRELMQDTKMQGYDIPKKTRVFVNVWAIGRDPGVWGDPEEFKPERFFGNSIDFKGQDYELLPFGGGRRVCPGIGFAVVVIELALANVVHRFDWELPNEMRGEELDMDEAFGQTVRRKNSLQLVAKPC
ncbi:Cytochrome P450 71A1 [Ananas comosus]|uniref:Cytochrome P450 71A1 n=1 Tax=Ananas comosus TaxID=4615 RepID=A0A199VUM4_ANACO|nr:Cytochrome P450 71A1 [Ananas comosus]